MKEHSIIVLVRLGFNLNFRNTTVCIYNGNEYYRSGYVVGGFMVLDCGLNIYNYYVDCYFFMNVSFSSSNGMLD